jgi:FKBP-type peptidyl-prolyl cis-trans isomerase FklB
MRKFWIPLAALALWHSPLWAQQPAAAPGPATVPLNTTQAQASYAIGLNVGASLRAQLASGGMQLDMAALIEGIRDRLEDVEPKLNEQQCQAALAALRQEMNQRRTMLGDKNRREGEAFLAANKAKAGVKTLPSGLQYQVLQQGNGPSPRITDKVRAHYHGTLLDGTVFDSSVERGEPLEIAVNGVIRGWTEALQLMKVGDKWRLFIPSDLAYGPNGAGDKIGPHQTLIFEIELLAIL